MGFFAKGHKKPKSVPHWTERGYGTNKRPCGLCSYMATSSNDMAAHNRARHGGTLDTDPYIAANNYKKETW